MRTTPACAGPAHEVQPPDGRAAQAAMSLAQARHLLRDLFAPRPWIYWADFLTTILIGHLCYGLALTLPKLLPAVDFWVRSALQAAAFFAACLLYFRAVMFIHELVHLPENKFRAFRIVWNLLCGIPFLVPSFTYYTHLDHHRRRSYGTRDDGEYVALTRLRAWHLALYFGQGLYVPPLVAFRFLVLTPLTWVSPALRRWVHQRASSLVMDPTYLRPQPTKKDLRVIRIQETCCFLWCLGVLLAIAFIGGWTYTLLFQAYAASVLLMTMNALRTAAAHRWRSAGQETTFMEQMQDSVTIDSDWLPSVLINPVGLRYHALHHLFPTLPYHNSREAHKRLLAQLPADSPYRATVERSVLGVLARLW